MLSLVIWEDSLQSQGNIQVNYERDNNQAFKCHKARKWAVYFDFGCETVLFIAGNGSAKLSHMDEP